MFQGNLSKEELKVKADRIKEQEREVDIKYAES
jgi:hypothetical protein